MPWVKIDEDFSDHPKIVAAGPLAMAMQVAAMCYCNKYLTDGYIPARQVPRLISLDGLPVTVEQVVKQLLDHRLWEVADGGYVIHDYADFQPSRDEALAEREAKRTAGRKGGKASAQARAKARGQAGASADGQAEGQAKLKPVPVPQETVVVEPARAPVEITEAAASREITAGWREVAPTTDVPSAIRHRLLNAAANGFDHALLRELAKRCASPTTRKSAPYLDQVLSDCERLGIKTLAAFLASETQGARAAPEQPQFLNRFV